MLYIAVKYVELANVSREIWEAEKLYEKLWAATNVSREIWEAEAIWEAYMWKDLGRHAVGWRSDRFKVLKVQKMRRNFRWFLLYNSSILQLLSYYPIVTANASKA